MVLYGSDGPPSSGSTSPSEDVNEVAAYLVVKHSWKGRYKRIFSIGTTGITTYNPNSMEATNQWNYQVIMMIVMMMMMTMNMMMMTISDRTLSASCLLPEARPRPPATSLLSRSRRVRRQTRCDSRPTLSLIHI